MTPGAPSPWCRRATPTSGRYDPAVRKTPLERWWTPLNICLGAALLVVALWYTSLLGPIVDPQVVIGATVGIIAMSAVGIRLYLASFKPLDPERPSSARLAALVDEAIALTGGARPRLALDESRLAKAVPNVGAVEMGPGSETILFTEQLVADLEAGRFGISSLRGVVLHELGHLHHDHSYLKLWLGLGERLIRFAALAALGALVFFSDARRALAAQPELAIAIAIGPFAVATVLAVVSRASETQADAFAIRHAAGRELLDFLRWMGTDLAPLFALERRGVPRDPVERARIRDGLARLVAEAEAVGDEERTSLFREALVRIEERDLEDRPGLAPTSRVRLVLRRTGRALALAWFGVVPWNRSHPPIEDRMTRIAAEIGSGAAV
jgi:Zn-dependent protease with chaperone function